MDIDIDGEVLEVDTFLEFNDLGMSYPDAERRATKALEEYTLDEIMQANEIDETELLGILFYNGDIGLPQDIEYEDEEMEGLQEETSED